MNINLQLAREFNLKQNYADNIVALIQEGNTIPFIARYRKEMHGGCDDALLRDFNDRFAYLTNLEKRKEEIKTAIEGQGKWTDELAAALSEAATLTEAEDIYRPYKQKKKTRASVAIEKGLQPLADIIVEQRDVRPLEQIAAEFIDAEKGVESTEDAIAGARDIIAEMISDGIAVAEGRYGKYLKTQDGRNIMIPRSLRDKLTPEMASLLVSLPKSLGKGDDGEDVLMMAGPYGFYAKCMGRNVTISDPFNPPDASALSKSAADSGKEKAPLADFVLFQDKPLQILSGRYGAYIKWGDKNYAIPKDEQKDAAGMSAERAQEIVLASPEKLNIVRDFGEFEGKALHLLNGRYGVYIKWGDKNVAIPSAERDKAGEMTAERAQELAKSAPDKKSSARRRKSSK